MQEQIKQLKELIDVSIQRGIFANAESVIAISQAFNDVVKFIHEHGNNDTNN